MGNDQSRTTDSSNDEARPPDYYELLQVDQDATDDEIKASTTIILRKAYRKLALVNHPDKNPHRIEEATKIFADLQQAYEILSDPDERAFYDRHRNAPIADDDLYDHVRAGDSGRSDPRSKLNRRRPGDPGVRLEQLMRFFDTKIAKRLDDSSEGFFSVYRSLFALLASDEALHADKPVTYPTFGDSTTPYAPPPDMPRAERYDHTWARDFYLVWSDFATAKRFEWVAKWDTERGDDRSMRRLMEKENKKIREDYRRDYNDTVQQLVRFVQHRDPRYKAHQSSSAATKRQAASNAAAIAEAKQREEARMQAAAEYQEQAWQKVHVDSDESDVELEHGEAYECVACNKLFQSEPSWINHERSKKHKQAVYRLKKEMQVEDEDLGLSHLAVKSDTEDMQDDQEIEVHDGSETPTLVASPGHADQGEKTGELLDTKQNPPAGPVNMDDKLDSNIETSLDNTPDPSSRPSPVEAQSTVELSKREKRRLKEARKKEEQLTTGTASGKASASRRPPARAQERFTTAAMTESSASDVGPRPKARKTPKPLGADIIDESRIAQAADDIRGKSEKLKAKWGQPWEVLISRTHERLGDQPLGIVCLGLGKCFADRTAQVQTALLLLLMSDLKATSVVAYDPVWQDEDYRVLGALGITTTDDNLLGRYDLPHDEARLLYLPHCPRALYESVLHHNFGQRLAAPGWALLGNELADYVPELARARPNEPADDFAKPKKKRKGRGGPSQSPRDGVLQRLVPHLEGLPLSALPETHLPGFARAFLSLSLQWLRQESATAVDWHTPLPDIVWPDDGELVA